MKSTKSYAGIAILSSGFLLTGCGGSQATDMTGYASQPNSFNQPLSTATSMSASTLGAKLLPIQGKPTFIAGTELSSVSGTPDHEFGRASASSTDSAYSPKGVTSALQDVAGFGVNVVRLTAFKHLDGLKLDANGVVTGLDDVFVKNLTDLVGKAESSKLQIYLTLSSPWQGSPAKNPITDTAARTAFLKNAVSPLMAKLRGRASVMAVGILGQVEAEVAGKDGNGTDKGATWEQARDYIKSCTDFIKSVDSSRLVTAGSGLHGAQNLKAGKLSRLGLDFYDFQTYDDSGLLPSVKELRVDRPVILGACGPKSTKVDGDLQAKADVAFLTNAVQQGYAGAFVGDYSKDSANPMALLDKDGKHRPVCAQLQTFVANLPMMSSASTSSK